MIRYLSEAEVERARPSVREGIDLARLALIALAEGRAQLPPKPSVYPRPGRRSRTSCPPTSRTSGTATSWA